MLLDWYTKSRSSILLSVMLLINNLEDLTFAYDDHACSHANMHSCNIAAHNTVQSGKNQVAGHASICLGSPYQVVKSYALTRTPSLQNRLKTKEKTKEKRERGREGRKNNEEKLNSNEIKPKKKKKEEEKKKNKQLIYRRRKKQHDITRKNQFSEQNVE